MKPLRVLVVDDSLANRQRIIEGLEGSGAATVVGSAKDGSEALRLVNQVLPDAVTLDLEMPRMDGFSFLRLLMSSRPTPVIVVSSYSQKENVFRALELGALDFVAKPSGAEADADPSEYLVEPLIQKLGLVRSVRHSRVSAIAAPMRPVDSAATAAPKKPPRHVVGIAASTGGPTALTEVMSRLSAKPDSAVLIAQHMPARFTTTFAERLDRYSTLSVREAREGDRVAAGVALVCPGNRCMELERMTDESLRVRLLAPSTEDRYVPNASRLLSSIGRAVESRAVGVVLTGMGDDGSKGAEVIAEAGGRVIVESEETAVVYGMPRAAARVVKSAESVALSEMHRAILRAIGDEEA